MKKITLFVAFFVSMVAFSQAPTQKIQRYLDESRTKLGLSQQDVSNWSIVGESSSNSTNITNYSIVQNFQGTAILGSESSAWVKNDEVMKMEIHFITNISQKVNTNTPALSVIQGIQKAYTNLNVTKPTNFVISENRENNSMFLSDGIQQDPIVAKLVFQKTSDTHYALAYSYQFYGLEGNHYWDMSIDAITGAVLLKRDLTINCGFGEKSTKPQGTSKKFNFSNALFTTKNQNALTAVAGTYRVIPYNYVSPDDHTFDLVTTAGDATASPNGWHDANAIGGTTASLKYTYSRGNNVLAQEDADGNNGTGVRADGGAALLFDFPYGGTSALPTSYVPASVTNLFYMTNMMHDVWYKYGFDETNHNMQQNNLGRGGTVSANGDAVYADAQDGYSQTTPTVNNSNFTPTADGVRPREQMFLWDMGAPPTNYLTVNSPATIAGAYPATQNVFDTTDSVPVPVAPNGIVADVVLVTNNPTPPGYNSACQVPNNAAALAGKIALVKRGGCFFSNKVFNAQQAGAIAVIVMDSIPLNPSRLRMSSTGVLGITIPAIFITKEIGDALIAEMANGPVNAKIEVPAGLYLFADADFDNTIVAHEYGHGISNRLVGHGATGCMTNAEQMGEGWSDWFGLMMQMKTGDTGADAKGVGNYVVGLPTTGAGIRNFPYSTDMTINQHTFIDSNDAEVHNLGEVWTTMLWDLTWAYVDKYGFDPNLLSGTGGNNKVMKLVIDALKLHTCNTSSFQSGRDNIYAAEQATTGGVDHCMIEAVFARRGLGVNASSGSVTNALDQTEDFTLSAACLASNQNYNYEGSFRVFPNPTNGNLNVRINNYVGKVTMQVVDINGRLVLSNNNIDFNVEKSLDISSLQTGMYVLKVTGDNINFAQKIVKE